MFKDWTQFRTAWVEALRSGDYVQGRNLLVQDKDGVDCFCCLGVAANLLIKAGHKGEWMHNKQGNWSFGTPRHRDDTVLSAAPVPQWLRKKLLQKIDDDPDDVEGKLMRLNDVGHSFGRIADIIEKL